MSTIDRHSSSDTARTASKAAPERRSAAARVLTLEVNGEPQSVAVQPYESLNAVLRDRLNLTGTKRGCDTGGCGTCTVLVDGQAVYSCMYPSLRAEGRRVETVEGLADAGRLSPLQRAVVDHGGVQCGYCTPGVLMACTAIYSENPAAGADDIAEELAGNLCRCTGYVKLIDALASVGPQMKENGRD